MLPLFALSVASAAYAADAPPTVGALLTAVTDSAPATASDAHALQGKLQQHWVGKTVTADAGTVIQIVTEGGGVKMVSIAPEETIGNFQIHRSLSHATLVKEEEAAGKKLVPGDKFVVTGTVLSLSAQFSGETENGKAVVRLNLFLKDARIVSTTIAPKRKKAPASTQAATPAAE